MSLVGSIVGFRKNPPMPGASPHSKKSSPSSACDVASLGGQPWSSSPLANIVVTIVVSSIEVTVNRSSFGSATQKLGFLTKETTPLFKSIVSGISGPLVTGLFFGCHHSATSNPSSPIATEALTGPIRLVAIFLWNSGSEPSSVTCTVLSSSATTPGIVIASPLNTSSKPTTPVRNSVTRWCVVAGWAIRFHVATTSCAVIALPSE